MSLCLQKVQQSPWVLLYLLCLLLLYTDSSASVPTEDEGDGSNLQRLSVLLPAPSAHHAATRQPSLPSSSTTSTRTLS
ncbi:uncharacterized protein C11orf24 homolog isoform X2 [Sparus aurata]|uniref:uncharacterized protein C11orf24 homolog isoform X2 n=1 Tax=Sparus aurata TaxID=8175 RepID=UPI0011C18A90|nr:uncharacterized protein C11orf24 homolog isoform X2 [Sparus aurata]